ncbi:AraC family transcriptional regulator [Lachnospiraceae bacterium 54-53]
MNFSSIVLYKNDLKTGRMEGECRDDVYELENKSGYGEIRIYKILPGIEVVYNDMHMEYYDCTDKKMTGILEINHCRTGRYECEFRDGKCIYIAAGDLGISRLLKTKISSSFPLGQYYGISIYLDKREMMEAGHDFYPSFSVNLEKLWRRFESQKDNYLIRGSKEIEHIFLQLYETGEPIRSGYLKIRILELLLFLSEYDWEEDMVENRYFNSAMVKTVKSIKEFICENLNEHYTLNQLSELFHVPLTPMKECFKGVYGVPVYTYLKKYRLQAAMEMLKTDTCSIDEISERIGYGSPSKFRVAFKEEIGITPTEFRKASKWA